VTVVGVELTGKLGSSWGAVKPPNVLSSHELHDFLNLELEGPKFLRSELMEILDKLQDETMLYLGIEYS
jgi:hypothetical protein